MKTSNKERTLQWIVNQYKKGNISFKHKLQRPVGQWNPKMRSLLIHSLLSGYPINPVYLVEEDGVMYTLDGSQRTSLCISYVNNEFALHKATPNVKITVVENGGSVEKEYIIAGKKFNKLDEDVQNTLLACSLTFCTLSNYTDDEVREMFRRQNSGKPLTGKLLRVTEQTEEFSGLVYELANHPFMDKLITPIQRKNGSDREFIIQTFMLIMTNHDNSFTSFSNKDVNVFVKERSEECINKSETLKEAMNKLDVSFDEIKIPSTSIPMVLYSAYRVTKDKGSFSKLVNIINDFLNNYDMNEEYKQYVLNGTGSSTNVSGRLNWWKNAIKSV